MAALRQLLDSETGGTTCPSCNMPFDKGKKRKLIDTCGHERCYSCMFRNEACPLCARKTQRRPVMERYTPSPQRQVEPEWQSPLRLPKPPKQSSSLAQSCPTPPHTRRRFFLSPKSLRSPFGQRGNRHSHENHVPLSGKSARNLSFAYVLTINPSIVVIHVRFTQLVMQRSFIFTFKLFLKFVYYYELILTKYGP